MQLKNSTIQSVKSFYCNLGYVVLFFAFSFFILSPFADAVSSYNFTRNLAVGMAGEDVTALQVFLAQYPSFYPEGLVTGYFGQATRRAVERFQVQYGLGDSATPGFGAVGPKTIARIKSLDLGTVTTTSTTPPVSPTVTSSTACSFSRSLFRGISGSDVSCLQRFLIARNLLTADSATGYFGKLTEIAVQRFQTEKGIVSSGTPASTGYGFVGQKTRTYILADVTSPTVFTPNTPPVIRNDVLTPTTPATPPVISPVTPFIPVVPTPIPPPNIIISITASASSVSQGGGVTIAWRAVNANSCMASGSWSGTKALSGSEEFVNLTLDRTYTLTCSGVLGFVTQSVNVMVVGSPPDTQSPTIPQSLITKATSQREITLSWEASTDNIGVTEYQIFRNNVRIGSSTNLSYSNGGLEPNTAYTYTVRAVDAAGNLSVFSQAMTATTFPLSAPTVTFSASPTSVAFAGSAMLTWSSTNTSSCSASEGWVGTKVLSGGESLNGLTTTKIYKLTCTGSGGVVSKSVSIAVGNPPDTTPPSLPSNLNASATATQIALSWNPATDATAVAGYKIYRNNAHVTTVASTSYVDTAVTSGVTYTYFVKAFDTAGNVSGASNSITTTIIVEPYVALGGGLLKRSDVALSSRWYRSDSRDTAISFLANRLLWMYQSGAFSVDEPTISRIKTDIAGRGYPVQIALPYYLNKNLPADVALQCADIKGNPTRYPFEASWDGRRPDFSIAEVRNRQLASVKKLIDKGFTVFQQDDPTLNAGIVDFGGCFSDEGMRDFNEFLKSRLSSTQLASIGISNINTFNYKTYLISAGAPGGQDFGSWSDPIKTYYRDFQKKVVADYLDWIHREARTYVQTTHPGTEIFFSGNLHNEQIKGGFDWIVPHFDFLESEIDKDLPNSILEFAGRAGSATPVATFPSADVGMNKRFIATTYASGVVPIVPWDVYVPYSPRFFGNPSDFTPYFRLVRDNKQLFDVVDASRSKVMIAPAEVTQITDSATNPSAVSVQWNKMSTVKNIPLQSVVGIGNKVYTTVSATTVGTLYLARDGATDVLAGKPIWFIKGPDGAMLFGQTQYPFSTSDMIATSATVTRILPATSTPSRIGVVWEGSNTVKNIPIGSTVGIGNQTYTTNVQTTVGLIYLPGNTEGIEVGDPVWYVQAPDGSMLYYPPLPLVMTLRTEKNGSGRSVAHMVNWSGTPSKLYMQIPQSFSSHTFAFTRTPENQNPRSVSGVLKESAYLYNLGTVDVWTVAYDSSLGGISEKSAHVANALSGISSSFLKAVEEWLLNIGRSFWGWLIH